MSTKSPPPISNRPSVDRKQFAPGRPVIEVENFAKTYDGVRVVDGIDFDVCEGEIFGILGSNGAGKTTTVECLQGLRSADQGRLRIQGLDPFSDQGRLRSVVGQPTAGRGTPRPDPCPGGRVSVRPHGPVDPDAVLAQVGTGLQVEVELRRPLGRTASTPVHRSWRCSTTPKWCSSTN